MAGDLPILIPMPCRGGDTPGDRAFAQGFTDDLQVELSRFHGLQLLCFAAPEATSSTARQSMLAESGGAFILRTTVRRAGATLRITAVLTEAHSEQQLWGEHYDVDTSQGTLFVSGDTVVTQTAVAVTVRLEDFVLHASWRKAAESLSAYELWVRGKALLLQGTTAADKAARQLFERAVAADPIFARAHAGLSLSWLNEWTSQSRGYSDENAQKAYEHAHTALSLDDTDAHIHLVVGRILLRRRNFDQATWYLDRALALAPHDTDCLAQLAHCYSLLGDQHTSLHCAHEAMRLRPFHPDWYCACAALPYLLSRQVDKAIALSRKVLDTPVTNVEATLTLCYSLKGETGQARSWFDRYEAQFRERIIGGRTPARGEAVDWWFAVNPLRRQADAAFIRDGFAGANISLVRSPQAIAIKRHKPPIDGAFVRKGAGWMLAYAGQTALVRDMKGIRDIIILLECPGEGIHCFDLSDHICNGNRDDRLLDAKARTSYQARIRDLQAELTEARENNDLGRIERLQPELDIVVDRLSKAVGLGGRGRRLGSMAERARSTVTWRIRYAIRRIETAHEPLGRHLRKSVRTGLYCSYEPETPLKWHLRRQVQRAAPTGWPMEWPYGSIEPVPPRGHTGPATSDSKTVTDVLLPRGLDHPAKPH